MDGSRFDRITQTLAAGQTRRQALAGIVGGALGGVLGLSRVEEGSAACVKPGKKGCKGPKNKKCCTGSVCKGGNRKKTGRCACKSGTTACGGKCVNTKTDKNNCGACGTRCRGTNTCQDGVCTGAFSCPVGPDYCADVDLTSCPDQSGCTCATDVDGAAHCSNTGVFCSDCATNADCGPGWVCVPDGEFCGCGGSGCMPTTCTQCTSGQNVCSSGSADDACPENGACSCLTSVEGLVVCSDLTVGFCTGCTSSFDCEPGQVCVEGAGFCCQDAPPELQNACVNTTCGSGSSSTNRAGSRGSGGFRAPLRR